MNAPRSRKDLEAALNDVLDQHYHHRHPFNLLMHEGRLSREALGVWVRNRYYYQTRIPIKDGMILGKAPMAEFRREWIEELGAELRADPDFSDRILEDIQVQGLDRFDDSAVIVRDRIKTKPLQQWGVRRAFNLRMKRRFDELGIEIPFPHQTIYFGEDQDGNAPAALVRMLGDASSTKPPPLPAA